ncbi:MAG: PLP-dependent aminotransferase family protein [Candidatus Bathyarchaeia archaeon]
MLEPEQFYSELGSTFKPGVITRVVLAADRLKREGKKIIGLTGGLYDEPSLPCREVKEIFAEADESDWRMMLQYGGTRGTQGLREELSEFMSGHDIEADPDQEVIVTTGSQEALDLTTRVFLDEGDVIIVGAPTYLSALSAFEQVNPDMRSCELDEEGMNPESLEELLVEIGNEGKTLKMLYTIPSFQNPTTTLMGDERRKRILELAEEYDFLILEDNPYGYISFDSSMPTPIAGFDVEGRVLYTSTFSKIVSPGMRIGWIRGHKDFIEKMTEAKSRISICNDVISQYAATQLFRRGDVKRQIEKMGRVYRKKRDVMLEAMQVSFPDEAEWIEPQGGLFIWVKLPDKLNTTELLMDAMQNGVAYIPGSNFFAKPVHNYIRLNFSHPSTGDIVEGIGILGDLFKKKLQE